MKPLDDFDELRRSLVVGYVITALTAVFAVLVIRTDHGNVGLISVAAFELCFAAFLAVGRSLPVWVIKFAAFEVAVGVIGAVVAFASPLGPAPLYYIWPALTAAAMARATTCADDAVLRRDVRRRAGRRP